jgi:hypothetical protein
VPDSSKETVPDTGELNKTRLPTVGGRDSIKSDANMVQGEMVMLDLNRDINSLSLRPL